MGAPQAKNFEFLNLAFQNGKMDAECTGLPQRNIPSPRRITREGKGVEVSLALFQKL